MERELRKIHDLILKNENYIFSGDLEIEGKIVIEKGSQLIVSGKLAIKSNDITVYGDISACEICINSLNEDDNNIFLIYGDIYAFKKLIIRVPIHLEGDIFAHGQLTACRDITCKNFFVDGNSHTHCINAKETIRILGNSYSRSLNARNIFINGDADFHNHSLIASHSAYIKGRISLCSSINVGN